MDITEQIPFEIPNSWTWARMGQVGDWGAGSTPQRGNQDYYGGNILWLKTGELNNDIVYDTEEKRLFANFGAHSAQQQNSLRKFYIKC